MGRDKNKEDWIRMPSKSRPGRFYLFHKATGETKWVEKNEEGKGKTLESPPKLSINKLSATPAQDRLKRLQSALRSCQTKTHISTSISSKEQENQFIKDGPSTSSSGKAVNKSPKNVFSNTSSETPCLEENEKCEEKNQYTPPKLSINKAGGSLAQDRLKKLQSTLSSRQSKTRTSTSKSSKKQENEFIEDGPSTSSSEKAVKKSPRKSMKRPRGANFPIENDTSAKCSKYSSSESLKKLQLPNSSIETSSTSPSNDPVVEFTQESSRPSKETLTTENLGNAGTGSSTLSKLRIGITKKIIELCKIPFSFSKKVACEKIENKAISKTKPKPMLLSSATKEALIKQIKEEKTLEDKMVTCPSTKNKPKHHEISSYSVGSANSRLERLRQSLLSQHKSCSTTTSSETPNVASCSSISNQKTVLPQEDIQLNSHLVTNNNTNNTKENEAEPMDWQPIVMENSQNTKSAAESTLVVQKSKKLVLKDVGADENQTMGDIIDTVNANLLRFSAEKPNGSKDNNKKWRKDFYYFVVDTNVLLKDLTFIQDLTEMRLCDTKGSILYIPYSVLQELDKLKMRSGFKEGVKTLAVRAIKYLNSKFESNSPDIQAQSALDELHHLINIKSADDSILNCCLQAKEHVRNIVLLTEDINLRNKAISNDIMVSTKSDLTARHYDSTDNP